MHSTSHADQVGAIDRALQQEDHEIAVQLLLDLSAQGHAESLLVLGCLCLGNARLGGNKRAFDFFQKAADLGNAKAQCCLGQLYDKGAGVAQSDTHAFYWLDRAAEQGLAEAQFWLAVACIEGKGVEVNEQRAVNWLTRAAAQGHADAQGVLGTMYASSKGVVENTELAIDLLTKAASQGISNARFVLDLHYLDQGNGPHLLAGEVPGVVALMKELYRTGGEVRG